MRRIAVIFVVLGGAVLNAGCNRQDAETLARISQMLADRAKSVPITGAQGKTVRGLATSFDSVPADVPPAAKKNGTADNAVPSRSSKNESA